MKKKFFIKNLVFFIIPLLVPVLILGLFVKYVMDNYVFTEINERNTYEIMSYANIIDSLMGELERLHTSLSTNPAMVLSLKKMLAESKYGISSEDYKVLNVIIDLLYASSNTNPYIESLYVYFNDCPDYFISSTNRLTDFNYFHDKDWYRSYQENYNSPVKVWTEYRTISRYKSEKFSTKVLTIYRKIYSSGKNEPDGILVLNVNADEVNKLLDTITKNEKNIFVTDPQKSMILFYNSNFMTDLASSSDFNINDIIENDKSVFNYKTERGYYTINKVPSTVYNWEYISAIRSSFLYRVFIMLNNITIFLTILAILISLAIAYYFANKNYLDIQNILNIIEAASKGEKIDTIPPISNDVYSFILHNIVRTFLENDFLQVQLSERKYHIRTLELLALQSQLNPHFLFNTMETIYWKVMALTGMPNEATMMIENLSDILHYSLDSDEEMATLEQEISIAKSYLAIQSVRYKNQFDVIWDCPQNIFNILVVKLILQPLIENSIYHGIKPKEGYSVIRIKIRLKDNIVKITVTDTGIGMTRLRLKKIKEMLTSDDNDNVEHIGLYNTNKRIKLIYGNQYGLHIRSKYNMGTSVIISIPAVFDNQPDN